MNGRPRGLTDDGQEGILSLPLRNMVWFVSLMTISTGVLVGLRSVGSEVKAHSVASGVGGWQ